MSKTFTAIVALLLLAIQSHASTPGLANATILIIRHAEKPAEGRGLAPEGETHARRYIQYFRDLRLDGQPFKLDSLIAAKDSKNSMRPRLTLQPLSAAMSLPLNLSFSDKDPAALAKALETGHYGRHILVCWHHGSMSELVRDLGADPQSLLPGGKWPADQFGWVLELRYDKSGNLLPNQCHRIVQ